MKYSKNLAPHGSLADLFWGLVHRNLGFSFDFFRVMAMASCFGFALFTLLQALLSVGATVVAVKTKVSLAASGATYLGFGALIFKCLPLATSLIELIFPAPAPVAPEPLMILGQLEHLDARQWSAVGCTTLSLLGWFFGRTN